jgi:hypothetical protein
LAERDMVPEGFENGAEFLSIPAMAIEYERAFSSVKKLITPDRNALADATIETAECLKAW